MTNETSLSQVDIIMGQASSAALNFAHFDQEHTDRIVRSVYEAAFNHRYSLAQKAFDETGIGKVQDKVIKNIIASRFVYEDIRNLKTAGIINDDPVKGITEIARPLGPVFAVTPMTNPTSTIIFKILICLKTRNPIVISPHGAARKSSNETARICYEAALTAGAPEHCIQWLRRTSKEEVIALMGHKHTALVLATGSVGLVRAAYSSGNPAIGNGPGNVPVYIGHTADIPFAVEQIMLSKTFDNGTVCASEQAVVVPKDIVLKVKEEFSRHNAYFLNPEEVLQVEKIAFNKVLKVMNAEVIGKPATTIAQMAGIAVPDDCTVLIAVLDKIGMDSPLSFEILAPILAFYEADDFEDGIRLCREINRYGGLGHTASIFSKDQAKINYFTESMNAGRILVNTPASQGALGGTYNALQPSMTLATGAGGKNITTDNITARHLINVQRVAYRRVSICREHIQNSEYCCNSHTSAAELESVCHRTQQIQT